MSSYFTETEEVIIGFRADLLYKRLLDGIETSPMSQLALIVGPVLDLYKDITRSLDTGDIFLLL